jgi:hypothetical protein
MHSGNRTQTGRVVMAETMLPNTNGRDTPEQRYGKAVNSWNVAVRRFNSAAGALEWAEREYADARRWLDEARDDLNRADAIRSQPAYVCQDAKVVGNPCPRPGLPRVVREG